MRFLADENIESSIIDGLKEFGLDIISIDELDKKGLSDEEILDYARENKRIVITKDSDFLRLNRKGIEHSGILFIPKLFSIGFIIREIEKISITHEQEYMQNKVIFISLNQ